MFMRENRFSLFVGPLASFNLPDVPFLLAAGLLLASLALSIREYVTAIGQSYPTEAQSSASET